MKTSKQTCKQVDKITFRLFEPYTQMVVEQAAKAKVNPNQFARIATMALVDGGLLNLSNRMQRIEDELLMLRLDFNDAVSPGCAD